MNTPQPPHSGDPLLSLPELVRTFIRDRYLAGVADAQAQYQYGAGDEDALTGALGALISMTRPVTFNIEGLTLTVLINYRKLRGRGPNAPEKQFGADGNFQIQISDANHASVFKKGLPFQAKKGWKGRDKRLMEQAREMSRAIHGGIVIDYSLNGYAACDINDVIEMRGNRKALDGAGKIRPLGQILANEFLDCVIGIRGLYYDNQVERFFNELGEREFSIIDTQISVGDSRLR